MLSGSCYGFFSNVLKPVSVYRNRKGKDLNVVQKKRQPRMNKVNRSVEQITESVSYGYTKNAWKDDSVSGTRQKYAQSCIRRTYRSGSDVRVT